MKVYLSSDSMATVCFIRKAGYGEKMGKDGDSVVLEMDAEEYSELTRMIDIGREAQKRVSALLAKHGV